MNVLPTVLITGASSGIGAVYAERFARRGHDLLLVARDKARLDTLAERLRRESGVAVEVLAADLTQRTDLDAVEARLREDARIGILVNNAGMAQSGGFTEQTSDGIERLVTLNTIALTRLAAAVAPRLAAAVQAVLPAATRTEIWERAGIDINTLPEVMDVGELVDAALVGFDRREAVTIPPLHVAESWDALEASRLGVLSNIRQAQAADRYRSAG